MQLQSKKLNFNGQYIYIGLDVHKKSWTVSIYTDELELEHFSQPPIAAVLEKRLRKNYPGATYLSVYEAGYCGYWIHRKLLQYGIQNIVVNPADVPTSDKEKRRKRDSVDARKLSKMLRKGELKQIYVPAEVQEQDRKLVRTLEAITKKTTRCKNQIKSVLSLFGIEIDEEKIKSHWSKQYIKEIEVISKKEENSLSISLKCYLKELINLREIKLEIKREIRKLSNTERYRENCNILITVPGISTISAMILLTELGDINRFKNLDHLCSYVGIAPDESSSGERENVIGITQRKNAHLRRIITESSWIAIRKDPAMLLSYKRYKSWMQSNKAIIKISRKLLSKIMHMLRNNEIYIAGKL
jgi:transposase